MNILSPIILAIVLFVLQASASGYLEKLIIAKKEDEPPKCGQDTVPILKIAVKLAVKQIREAIKEELYTPLPGTTEPPTEPPDWL